jgi:hypothetical protein
VPSVSADTVTSASAASVATTSTVRRMVSWRTASTLIGRPSSSVARAWAVCLSAQPATAKQAAAMNAVV